MDQIKPNQIEITPPKAPAVLGLLAGASSWPTNFSYSKEVFMEACCALHVVVDCGELGGVGCRGWSHGTHRSIAVLYNPHATHYCHSELPVRAIDFELFQGVVKLESGFLARAYARKTAFQKRYFGGFPVDISVYGAGFCYLSMFPLTVRSRVARCLGPLPLVADVLRFAVCVGDYTATGFSLVYVDSSAWHVECGKGSKLSFIGLLKVLLSKLTLDCRAVIGADSEALVKLDSVQRVVDGVPVSDWEIAHVIASVNGAIASDVPVSASDIRVTRVPAHGSSVALYPTLSYTWHSMAGFEEFCSSDRVRGLQGWLVEHDIVYDGDFALLALATCASSFLVDRDFPVKVQLKMWAVLGDSVMKQAQAQWCLSNARNSVDYTEMSKSTQNSVLASTLLSIGLRDHCYVQGLSSTSKANADILEAVVGLVSIFSSKSSLRKLLGVVGVVPMTFRSIGEIVNETGFAPTSDVVGLNSLQYTRALRLASKGII